MKKEKILININNLSEIEEYKKIGITNFLFAVTDYSIGYTLFNLSELKTLDVNVYLLLNRLMDSKTINQLKEMKEEFNFVKGIFFEDIGVYNIFKDTNIPLIFNQTQFGTNLTSINCWLEKTHSAVLSNSITKEEIIEIVNNVKKPIVFNIFAKNMIMYSRRTLLSNFNDYMGINAEKEVYLKEPILNKYFIAKEDENGTIIFNDSYFNYMSIIKELNDANILFYYINNLDLKVKDINDLLNGVFTNYDNGFLDKKTVFKVGDLHDRTS